MLHALSHLTPPYKTLFIPILQMKNLNHRDIKLLAKLTFQFQPVLLKACASITSLLSGFLFSLC